MEIKCQSEVGPIHPGLEGVIVGDTELTSVDGTRGELLLRGYPIAQLAGHHRFAAVAHLLWTNTLPTASQHEVLERRLGEARAQMFADLPPLEHADGMDALRAGLCRLTAVNGGGDPVAVCGAVATIVAAWVRGRSGARPLAPNPALDHASDFLRMATGHVDHDRAAALDAYLVTVIDHGMNASTFTARVVASTGADLVSAVVAAVGALKGPLHGGAPGPVLDMLDAIKTRQRVRPWIEQELAAGRRIMGMGHRVYRVRDPRAAVLEQQLARLAQFEQLRGRIDLARAVEQQAQAILQERYPNRSIRANVEFYTALVLEAAGLPRAAFSPTFAVGRVAGWCAHVDEQRRTGRLIRPRARYTGRVFASAS